MDQPLTGSLRARAQDRLGPLREANFARFFASYGISLIGDGLIPVALSFAVLDATGSATALGIVLLARFIPMVSFTLIGGVWADRLPRHHVLIGAHVVRALSQGLLASLIVSGRANLSWFVVCQVVYGTATAFERPATNGLVPRLISATRLHSANALIGMALASSAMLGPALAGAIVATAGPGWALVVDAATFILAASLLLRLRASDLGVTNSKQGFWNDLSRGWTEVRTRTWLWASILYFSTFQFFYVPAFTVLGPVVAHRSLGGASAWAVITTATGGGLFLGSFLAARIQSIRPLVGATTSVILAFPTLVLLAFAAPTALIATTEIAGGAAIGFASTTWAMTMQRAIPGDALSRVASYDWMGSTALRPLGLALIGPIGVTLGIRSTLLGIAAVMTATTIVVACLPAIRRMTVRASPAFAVQDHDFADA